MDLDLKHVIGLWAKAADDFLLNVLLLKAKDYQNDALPFLHAHALELSAKCALLTLDPVRKITDHKLKKIYDDIAARDTGFGNAIPSPGSFDNYKNLYSPQTGNNTNVTLPENPEKIYEYELCYFIENVADLKYGFHKSMKLVSALSIKYEPINDKFLKLFFACRKIYKNEVLDRATEGKSMQIFGESLLKKYKDYM